METKEIKQQIKRKIVEYIGAALGLVAALAWNDAIKSTIDYFFVTGGGLIAKIVYAILISIIVVTITYYLVRIEKKDDSKK
jgi:uncharacterized membrane protein